MRIIFIPGFGEEPSIFEKLHPLIKGEKVFIDNWRELEDVETGYLDAFVYAEHLINRFSITKNDLVIGHSMGGWIAFQMKQIIGCPIVQIASFTDQKKVFNLPIPRSVIYWFAERGIVFNCISRKIIVLLHYRNKPSEEIFSSVFKKLQAGNKQIVVKQLKIVLNPTSKQPVVQPELRIHALADRIVNYPDEPFIKVPGDHFSLYTYAELVSKPINEMVMKLQKQ